MRIGRHRLRVSIRTQLIVLVMFVAMFSLLILAVVCGVYFTSVFTDARISKLQVAAQLKSVQMQQAFESFSYQIQQLSTKPEIQKALSVRKAGNTSEATLDAAKSVMYQTMQNTNGLIDAQLYDLNFKSVVVTQNPNAKQNASEMMLDALYVLSSNDGGDGTLPDGLLSNGGYLEGPYIENDTYFMSMTVAIYANESILIHESFVTGYLTVIIDAKTLADVAVTKNTSDYSAVNFYIPISTLSNATDLTGFLYAFMSEDMTLTQYNTQYQFNSFQPAESVFINGKTVGQNTKIRNPLKQDVSLGYAAVNLGIAKWMVTVEQTRSNFIGPTTKLIKIMVGVCIGLAALMCIITFPLAHYGVRPILELQKATENITQRRGIKSGKRRKRVSQSIQRNRFNPFNHQHSTSNSTTAYELNEKGQPATDYISEDDHSPNRSMTHSGGSQSINLDHTNNTGLHDDNHSKSHRNSWPTSASSPSSNDSFEQHSDLENQQQSNQQIQMVKTNGIFYDELNELTDAFNAMSLELEKQYTHLEYRVKARTKELELAKIQADAARQQAEAANEAKTVFIANISHELRTPLNGILGMTSVAMTEEDPAKIQSSLDLIFRSGELLLHILTQLLTFSKNQLDKSKLQKKNFLMLDVALQIYSIFGKTAKDRDIKLIITLKPDFLRDIVLYGDSNRIIQVVMNLVSNSLKFTPKDGTVRVLIEVLGEYDEERSKEKNYEKVYIKGMELDTDSKPVTPIVKKIEALDDAKDVFRDRHSDDSDSKSIKTFESDRYHNIIDEFKNIITLEDQKFNGEDGFYSDGDSSTMEGNRKTYQSKKFVEGEKPWVIRLSVSDTGTGIDESLQGKIFDAFVQGDQTLSRQHGGTGLGLSICKQFAKMMHGTITLNSKIGEGSTFTFTIPLPQVGELDKCQRESEDRYSSNYLHKRVKFAVEVDDEDLLDSSESSQPSISLAKSYNHSPSHNANALSVFDKPDLITRASTGTGTSYKSLQSHEDEVIVPTTISESDKPGTGQIVTTPPLVQQPSLPSPMSSKTLNSTVTTNTAAATAQNNSLKILVAEDNLVNQEVVKRMLIFEGIGEITLARDGNDAIAFVRESVDKHQPFDLILMDVQMPNLDGLSATRILREEGLFTGPIVALTAFADKSNEDECLNAGMSGFLAKPIRRPLLRKIIAEVQEESEK